MLNPSVALEVVALTSSGALSPGPLTFSAILGGHRAGWRYGFLTALGHMFFELPLYFVLSLGAYHYFQSEALRRPLSVVGGLTILFFVYLTLRDLRNLAHAEEGHSVAISANPIVAGFTLTAFNPYFLAWWSTVGVKMLTDVMGPAQNLLGALLYYPVHVWMDFAWLSAVALASRRGSAYSSRASTAVQLALSAVMLYYAAKFLADALA